MQTRHRIPTIFNLSMVDVLCCALGCVIFLWLVNLREAKRRAKTVGETGARLVETRAALEGARRELTSVRDALAASQTRERQAALQLEETQSDRDRARQLALATRKDYDDTRAALQTAMAAAGELRKDLKALRASHAQVTLALADKNKEFAGLDQRLHAAGVTARTLEMHLEERRSSVPTPAARSRP
jgi:chromosome segregation ATPase